MLVDIFRWKFHTRKQAIFYTHTHRVTHKQRGRESQRQRETEK